MGLFDLGIPDIWKNIENSWKNIGNLWKDLNRLKEEVSNSQLAFCNRCNEIEGKLNNPEWGVWHRIVTLEEQNAGNRLAALEKENAELKERVRKLEELADNLGQLEVMLTRAVNEQLGKQ